MKHLGKWSQGTFLQALLIWSLCSGESDVCQTAQAYSDRCLIGTQGVIPRCSGPPQKTEEIILWLSLEVMKSTCSDQERSLEMTTPSSFCSGDPLHNLPIHKDVRHYTVACLVKEISISLVWVMLHFNVVQCIHIPAEKYRLSIQSDQEKQGYKVGWKKYFRPKIIPFPGALVADIATIGFGDWSEESELTACTRPFQNLK